MRILPLAEALRALGSEPIVLQYSEDRGSFFLSRGIRTIALNPYRRGVTSAEVTPGSIGDMFWKQQNYPIYKIKHDLLGSSRETRNRDAFMLRRDALGLSRLIEDAYIDRLIVWNGVTGHTANALRIIGEHRKIAAGYLERGLFKNSVFFDRRGTNGSSLPAKGIDTAHPGVNIRKSVKHFGSYVKRHLVSVAREAADTTNVIFVPLQVQLDSNILLYSAHIKTMRQLVLRAIDLASALGTDWTVVVRDHPEEEQQKLNIPFGDKVRRDNVSSLQEAIRASKVVFTVNSTVGLTAAMAGKVVVANGRGIYCSEPFIINAQDLEVNEVAERVRARLDGFPDVDSLIRFGSVLLDRHTLGTPGEDVGDYPKANQALWSFARKAPDHSKPTRLQIVRELLADGSPLAVTFEVGAQTTLILDYRNSAAPLTKAWLMETLRQNYKREFLPMMPGSLLISTQTVCIAPSSRRDFNVGHESYYAVLDEYGQPHRHYYGE